MDYPGGGVTVKVTFFCLDGMDDVRLFHPKCVNAHLFADLLDVLKSHLSLLFALLRLRIIYPKGLLYLSKLLKSLSLFARPRPRKTGGYPCSCDRYHNGKQRQAFFLVPQTIVFWTQDHFRYIYNPVTSDSECRRQATQVLKAVE